MKFKCIGCNFEWGEEAYKKTKEISHGLCADCFIKQMLNKIRKKQQKEGNFPCFGTATNYCDQFNCKYYDICVRG